VTVDETYNVGIGYCFSEVVTGLTPLSTENYLFSFAFGLHMKRNEFTFKTIAHANENVAPELADAKLSVTDGAKPIQTFCKTLFKNSVLSQCRNHWLSNLKDVCVKNQIDPKYATQICGNGTVAGYLDLPIEEYEKHIQNLPEPLFDYWMKNKDKIARECMLKEVLNSRGIDNGKDTLKLYTNSSESFHSKIKKGLGNDVGKLDMAAFLIKADELYDTMYEEITRIVANVHPKYHLSDFGKEIFKQSNPKDVRSWEFWKEKIKEGTAELESASTTRAEVEEYYNDVSYLEKMGAIYKLKRPPTVLFRKSSKIYNLQELKKVLMESLVWMSTMLLISRMTLWHELDNL